MPNVVPDAEVDFEAFFVKAKTKSEQRRFIADHAITFLTMQKRRGARGAVMVDIDDTLIDGNENVSNGFQHMHDMYHAVYSLFPLHIVTARPRDQHAKVMGMLTKLGFLIPPDRLHMLPTHLYGLDTRHVEEFKWKAFLEIAEQHEAVVARFGDRLWDVAHIQSLDTYLKHVHDKDCYLFFDPRLKGCLSAKLPGT